MEDVQVEDIIDNEEEKTESELKDQKEELKKLLQQSMPMPLDLEGDDELITAEIDENAILEVEEEVEEVEEVEDIENSQDN